MLERAVLPDLRSRAGEASVIRSRTLRTWGLAESGLAEVVAGRVEALEAGGPGVPTIAFLASGIEGIKVRLTVKAPDEASAGRALDAEEAELRALLGETVFGLDEDTMETAVGRLLMERRWSLGVAESLTGGLIAARVVAVPGASDWFRGAVVAYDSAVKRSLLDVPDGPVVTAEAAAAMAEGARRALGAEVGLATTGVAGPTEQEGRPVGTVIVGLALPGTEPGAVELRLPGDREVVRQLATISALDALRRRLRGARAAGLESAKSGALPGVLRARAVPESSARLVLECVPGGIGAGGPPTNICLELQCCHELAAEKPGNDTLAVTHPFRRLRPEEGREEKGPTMERDKALEAALGQIEKQFGKGSVMRMGEHSGMGIEVISTGAMALDLALGIGGLPRGRIIEVFGPESSGKSTLGLHVVAEAQRNGGICAYIDAEHALDPVYAKAIGVDIDELLISQPDTGEQGLEIADMLIRSGAMDVIVIDSVAALTPRAELEGDMGDTHVGLQARLMSQALRKLTGTLSKSSTIALFINQLREKVGVIYGSPEVTPGGRALKFYSSVRLDIRRVESIKDGAEVIGNRTRVKVVKNKCAPPFRMAEFDIVYGKGISREGSVLDVAVDLGIAKKSGAWYTYEGEQLGQGRENAKQFLRDSPELMIELDQRIRVVVAEKAGLAVEKPIGAGDLIDEDEPISLD